MQHIANFRNVNLSRQRARKDRARFYFQIRMGRKAPLMCDGCGGDFERDPGPVLYDRFWKRISRWDEERLCHKCVVKRLGPIRMWYHILDCPWNTNFMDPGLMNMFGSTGRCWWRGPSAMRIRHYGTYVYDEAAMVRIAFDRETALVAGDELFANAALGGVVEFRKELE